MPRSRHPKVKLKLPLKREVTKVLHWSSENIGIYKYMEIHVHSKLE